MHRISVLLAVGSFFATSTAMAAPDVIRTSTLAIERSNTAVWAAAYQRLFTALRNADQAEAEDPEKSRKVDEIALRYVDRALLDPSVDQGQVASAIDRIAAPELRALGYLRLGRWAGTERWLRPALEALKSASVGQEEVDNVGRALADTAMQLGEVQLAVEAIALIMPGPARAAAASGLARLKGAEPDAYESWTDQAEKLNREGDLRGAITLAMAADAWEDRKERDKLLSELAQEALEKLGPASAIAAANAIYSARARGAALGEITEELVDAERTNEAMLIARQIRDHRSASAAWLSLADASESKDEQADRLRRAVTLALAVEQEPQRSDALADALKRLAERDDYATAYALADCISEVQERDRVVAASAKRAAELGDLAAGERMIASLEVPESEASKRASKALEEARDRARRSGKESAAPTGDSPRKILPSAEFSPEAISCVEDEKGRSAPAFGPVRPGRGPVSIGERQAELTRMGAAVRNSYCAAEGLTADLGVEPIAALRSTDEYGSDQSAEDFAWSVMILAGRHLGGDAESTRALAQLLVRWAEAEAFLATEVAHDAYYALKRTLLPTVVAYTLIADEMGSSETAVVQPWLDTLVRRVDRLFDGDVDRNNHRYLADSVQMAWGSWTGDRELFGRGVQALETARSDLRADGSLPLETRRGARALWYMRQAASSITFMVHLLDRQGFTELAEEYRRSLLLPVTEYLVDGTVYPSKVLVWSAANYIPGPDKDYFEQDIGFLETRGHGRHYMAWSELILARNDADPTVQRLRLLAERQVFDERPLIDEFAGGNATCFWASDTSVGGHG